jgi:hypothetical protein
LIFSKIFNHFELFISLFGISLLHQGICCYNNLQSNSYLLILSAEKRKVISKGEKRKEAQEGEEGKEAQKEIKRGNETALEECSLFLSQFLARFPSGYLELLSHTLSFTLRDSGRCFAYREGRLSCTAKRVPHVAHRIPQHRPLHAPFRATCTRHSLSLSLFLSVFHLLVWLVNDFIVGAKAIQEVH